MRIDELRRARAARLRQARIEAGFDTAKAAAESLGVSGSTYAAHEAGTRHFGEERAAHYARRFRKPFSWLWFGDADTTSFESPLQPAEIAGSIPVIGRVAAGVWQEVETVHDASDPDEWIPAFPHPRFPARVRAALKVEGDSIALIAPPGSYVDTVPLDYALPADGIEGLLREAEMKNRPCVVVTERRRGGLVEATLKVLARRPGGGYRLEFRSSNPRYQRGGAYENGLDFDAAMLGEDAEIRITRVMIGKYESTF